MDDIEQSSGLLMIGLMGLMAFLIVAVVGVGWLLWEVGRVLL